MTIGVVASLILMTLKLIGYIDWSWWYVALPALAELAISLAILSVVLWWKMSRR